MVALNASAVTMCPPLSFRVKRGAGESGATVDRCKDATVGQKLRSIEQVRFFSHKLRGKTKHVLTGLKRKIFIDKIETLILLELV